jgi:hypothetical protein
MSRLPSQFSELEPFVDDWAHATENARSEQRWRSEPERFQAFYDAMLARLDELLEYFSAYETGAIPDEALPLYRLTIAFAEAAPHVEMYKGSAEVPNSFEARRFAAAHGKQEDN